MKNFFKKTSQQKMTSSEKKAVLNSLKSFMMKHPAHSTEQKGFAYKFTTAIKSPFHNRLFQGHRTLIGSLAVVILLVSVTGGTSSIAQYSLPGDLLYPVKINFNEKVESFVSFDTQSKALIEVKHLDTRLAEAETLNTTNKLEGSRKDLVEMQFTKDLKSTINHINSLNSEGNTKNANKIKVKIETSLIKHKGVIDRILERNSDTDLPENMGNEISDYMDKNPQASISTERGVATTSARENGTLEINTRTELSTEQSEKIETYSSLENNMNKNAQEETLEIDTPVLQSILKRIR